MLDKPTFEIIGAACWASALVNGDFSGLSEEERAALEHWLAIELNGNRGRILDVKRDAAGEPEDPHFTWNFDLFTHTGIHGGDVLTFIAA